MILLWVYRGISMRPSVLLDPRRGMGMDGGRGVRREE